MTSGIGGHDEKPKVGMAVGFTGVKILIRTDLEIRTLAGTTDLHGEIGRESLLQTAGAWRRFAMESSVTWN